MDGYYACPSSTFRWAIPQAPRSQSRTSRYFRTSPHPSTLHNTFGRSFCSSCSFLAVLTSMDSAPSAKVVTATIAIGTEKLNPDLLETQRYITGSFFTSSSSSFPSASPSPSPAEDPRAGVSAREVAAVPVARLFLACGRDCFFSRRLIVSA